MSKGYRERLEAETEKAYEVAEKTREQEKDPESQVDIPVAEDLAAKSVGLVTTDQFPELEGKGVEERIRELEEEYGKNDERVALVIGREVSQGRFHEFGSKVRVLEAGIRIGLSYMTGGIVTAPLEGVTDVEIRTNDDGSEYLAVHYSGPIRSAGGTASAMSVLLADHIRKEAGLDRYKPREEEIERYATEVEDYFMRVTKKQYTPERDETRMIAENVPVEVTGTPTEQMEVSNYKDLPRVETNRIRGGMCLVYLDGLPLKASKLQRRIESFGGEFGLEHWDWIEDYLELQNEIHSSDEGEAEETQGYEPSDKFLGSLTAGRPVFSHPGMKGGFRLRYGRSRCAGLAAVSFHPATMEITDGFMAIGTQLKTEYPGKATVATPCDSIEPPVVRLDSGDVVRVESREEAKELRGSVDEILFMGDVLVPYGEFLENGKELLPSPYVEEWWVQDLEAADVDGAFEAYRDEETITPNVRTALTISRELDIPLHPAHTFYWDNLEDGDVEALHRALQESDGQRIPQEEGVKQALEHLYVEHSVEDDALKVSEGDREVMDRLLKPGETAPQDFSEEVMMAIEKASGVTVREQAPVFLGNRMGRPEKAERRTLKGKPQLLFPCGRKEGGRMRNLSSTYEEGSVTSEAIGNHCRACNAAVPFSYCPHCGGKTRELRRCPKCGTETQEDSHCGMATERSWERELEVKTLVDAALDNLGMDEPPELLKSPRGVTGRHKHVEPIEKGLLREKHDLYVNKDGTVRYDATDIPMTHFRPEEIGVSVERLKELGYERDVNGDELESQDQLLELKYQDIIIPDNDAERPASEYILSTAGFVDELLEKFYGQPPYYGADSKEDLVGELVVGLAPHTSGGIIGRIIGFTEAKGIYAHPFWHAAKRRNCVPGDTEIVTSEGAVTLSSLFERGSGGETVDRFGTEKVDVNQAVVSYDRETKTAESKDIDAVYRTTAQDHLIEFTTDSGRTVEVFPDHRMWTPQGVKRARELEEGDHLFTQRKTLSRRQSGEEEIDILDILQSEDVMVRDCSDHIDRLIEELGGLSTAADRAGITMKALDNYRRRDSIPVPVLHAMEDAAGVEGKEGVVLAAKRDTVEIPRVVDRTAFARLLGLYAAEGHTRRSVEDGAEFYQVNICYGEEELEDLIGRTVYEVFGIEPNDADHEKVISSRIVYDFFKTLGVGEGSHTKRVPDIIRRGPDRHAKEFLSGYFAGDGSVERGRLHVSCQSVSHELLEEIGLLLQRFGIFYRLRESVRTAGGVLLEKYGQRHYEGREFTSSKLQIRSEHAVSFGEEIGFALPRKQAALERSYDKVQTSREVAVNDLVKDEISGVTVKQSSERYMYDIEVADNHNFATKSGIVSQNCDGDEDSIILLMDALLNFSRQFLPDQRGTRTMDAPLILSTVLLPDEVDDESWNVDVAEQYPREFYEATQDFPEPGEVDVPTAEDILDEKGGFSCTHDTTDVRDAPVESSYVSLGEMAEKVREQLALGERIKAVDEDNVAELLLDKHFLPDIRGNLRSFSEQRFRCVDCNKKYRRVPLKGRCGRCGGRLLLTISEGTIRKYLVHSEEISDSFAISPYIRQQIMIMKRNIESLFGKDDRQSSLGQFVSA